MKTRPRPALSAIAHALPPLDFRPALLLQSAAGPENCQQLRRAQGEHALADL